jgi:hypothetical protein
VGVLALLALLGDAWGGYGPPWPLLVVGVAAIVLLSARGSTSAGPPLQTPGPGPDPRRRVRRVAGLRADGPTAPPARDTRRRGPILFWFTLALMVFCEGVLGMADLAGAPVTGSAYPRWRSD